jgi:capsid protein
MLSLHLDRLADIALADHDRGFERQELVEQWVNYATLADEFTGQFLQPLWDTFVNIADISGVVRRPADV